MTAILQILQHISRFYKEIYISFRNLHKFFYKEIYIRFCKEIYILLSIFTKETPTDEELDTTIQGPWMKKWEIVHMNAHTDKHEEMERKER